MKRSCSLSPRRIVRAIVLLSTLLPLTACRQQRPQFVYLLLDVSASTNSPEIRAQYLREVDAIGSALSENGGVIRGDVISTDALNNSRVPIHVDMPSYSILNSTPQKHANAVKVALALLHQQVEAAITDHPAAQQTPIMESLQMAQKVINGSEFKLCQHKQLIIFSDMVQESPIHNFAREPINADLSQRILKDDQAAGRVPDLAGVKVWKTGASAEGLSDERISNLQAFWIDYFRLAGADLSPDRYSSSLLNYSDN